MTHEETPDYTLDADPDAVTDQSIRDFYKTYVAPASVKPTLMKIETAYNALMNSRIAFLDAFDHESRCKDDLEAAERDALLSGAIDGKNSEIRTAQMFNRTAVQVGQLRDAANKRRRAELDLHLATDDVQRIRTLISLIAAQA